MHVFRALHDVCVVVEARTLTHCPPCNWTQTRMMIALVVAWNLVNAMQSYDAHVFFLSLRIASP